MSRVFYVCAHATSEIFVFRSSRSGVVAFSIESARTRVSARAFTVREYIVCIR